MASAAAASPLVVQQVQNLTTLGISPASIGFRNLTMDSDKAICVRDETAGKIVVVDTLSGRVREKMDLKGAESAIVSPSAKLIAVRAAQTMKVFNLDLKKEVKSGSAAEGIQYWKWITDTTLVVVTQKAVYHWSTEGGAGPVKMFALTDHIAGTQIINYAASADNKWLAVTGIKPGADGKVAGRTLFYSVERAATQPLNAYICAFATANIAGASEKSIIFIFVEETKAGARFPKVFIREVRSTAGGFRAPINDLPLPADSIAANDFPMALQVSEKHDFVYVFTKLGYVFLIDIHTGQPLSRVRASEQTLFATATHEATSGALAIALKTGQMTLVTVNESALVPYVLKVLNKREVGMALASRLGLGGADDLYQQQLNSLLSANQIERAAKLAAKSPGGILRTSATIERFKSLPTAAGAPPPIMQYFAILTKEAGSLNKAESLEVAQNAIAKGKVDVVRKLRADGKLESSAALGDLLARHDAPLALEIYRDSGEAHEKVVNCYMSMGEYAKIVPYAIEKSYAPNWLYILQNVVGRQPEAALEMAKALYKAPTGPMIEIPVVVQTFMQFQRLNEATKFMLDALSRDLPEEGPYQTQVLELNLTHGARDVVEMILNMNVFHHFDRAHIARLCEKAGLLQRALELFSELPDIKRVLLNAHAINQAFLVKFLGTLSPDESMECMHAMLKTNQRGNVGTVVKVATEYTGEELTPHRLIELLEEFSAYDGLYYYLGAIVNKSEDPEVHYKYIVAAAKMKQYKEVERVCQMSTVYNPEQVKDFLIEARLENPRPLIHVGDRHGFVDEVTTYLWKNGHRDFIQVYVQKVRPAMTPVVVGKLLDLDADEEYIKALLNSVRGLCPVGPLVEEVETRNRLHLLRAWLEQLAQEGNTDPATHNAIGKIYIRHNHDPQEFLKTNLYYESKVLGKFCEKLDPYLSFLAYRRSPDHSCDAELIEVTNENGLFKDQARYLVERRDNNLWKLVLADTNPHRRHLIDEVIGTALPECEDSDDVSFTVQAFMDAELPNELIGLLEKLVLQRSEFSDNRNLQNLLILTAIRCSNEADAPAGRAMDYITRLDNFSGPEIAKIALREEFALYEEAFVIFNKIKDHESAVDVLLNQIQSLDRAFEYAERVNEDMVWTKLARAQLGHGMVREAIEAFIKSGDPSDYAAVITAAENSGKFEELVGFLEMCRAKGIKERVVDTALIYALAQVKRLGDLELFISSPNVADMQGIGDRCYDEEMYEAARLIFSSNNNNGRLASTLVHLHQFREAVDAAKKANSIRTWKEVNAACVEAEEFRLAQIAGLQIIQSPDHLDELVHQYEQHGHFEELIKLMVQGSGLESAHKGIFTGLGVLYAKYQPENLMEHIKVFWPRCNFQRLLRACEEGLHWKEATYLYVENKDYDDAVRTMIKHSPDSFEGDRFLDIITRVRNSELHYAAITFYLEEQPMDLGKLLKALQSQLDHSRVVHMLRKTDDLPLIMDYLRDVQEENKSAVNEALNEIYVEEEDHEALRKSVSEYDNFNQIALAQRIEKHELLEFRRIAATLYKNNKRWEESINLSKADRMFKDAIDTTAESRQMDQAEGLLKFFVDAADKEGFCATLYTCYDLIRPDVALELAWRHRLTDYVMPYMIQYLRTLNTRVAEIDARTKPPEEEKADDGAAAAVVDGGYLMQPTLQIAATAYNDQYNGGGGGGVPGMGGGAGAGAGAMGLQPGMSMGGIPPAGMGMGGIPPSGMGGIAAMPTSGPMGGANVFGGAL